MFDFKRNIYEAKMEDVYESPITVVQEQLMPQITHDIDRDVMKVLYSYDIHVDKEELLKALKYDRQQYEKGYADGKRASKWIPCSERLPNPKGNEEFVRVEVTIQGKEKNVNMPAFYYYRIHKFFPWNIGGSPLKNVIAWMPLPEAYKGEV